MACPRGVLFQKVSIEQRLASRNAALIIIISAIVAHTLPCGASTYLGAGVFDGDGDAVALVAAPAGDGDPVVAGGPVARRVHGRQVQRLPRRRHAAPHHRVRQP
ncbi:hypothetical protein MSG28_005678, partial [Choristoneura fumiferana]